MKAKTFLAIVFLCGSFGLAQAQPKIMFFGGSGISFPIKSDLVFPISPNDVGSIRLADGVKTGFNVGVGVGFFFGKNQRIGLRGTIDYNTLPPNGTEALRQIAKLGANIADVSILDAPSLNLLNISLDIMVNIGLSNPQVVPYFIGGVNWDRSSAKDLTVSESGAVFNTTIDTDSGIGFNVGAGLSLYLTNRLGLFAEARYSFIKLKNEASTREVGSSRVFNRDYVDFGGYIPVKIGCFINIGSN